MVYTNLGEILTERKELSNIGITFIEGSSKEKFVSYRMLYEAASKGACFLKSKGIRPGSELVFQLDNNEQFVVCFWSCILAGIIPVPLSVGQNDYHRQKLFNIWSFLNDPYIISSPVLSAELEKAANKNGHEKLFNEIGHRIIYFEDLDSYTKPLTDTFNAHANDIAFIQFSSGSTGYPKGVTLTHQNLITNIQDISTAAGYSETDSMMSWMPLYHDMGLIGFHLNPLFIGINQALISTPAFIRNPSLWLDKASAHRATILCSPNFGFSYVVKHHQDRKPNIDLSQVRIIYNGAEPVSVVVCEEFLNVFQKHGLKKKSLRPVYGLAEASLAVSIPDLDWEILFLNVDRESLSIGDRIVINTEQKDKTVSIVCVGKPINNPLVRIVNGSNTGMPDEVVGHIQIKGKNVTSGYYNNTKATKDAFAPNGWLDTGDLGFFKDGLLYITGRYKDIIFANGKNFYAHDIEEIVLTIPGIELNKVVVSGFFDEAGQREETIAFVFHRGDIGSFVEIARSLVALVSLRAGLQIGRVIPVKNIPRTTSGKLQRFVLLEQYRRGEFLDAERNLYNFTREAEATSLPESVEHLNYEERKLVDIWKLSLRRHRIGKKDNFFEIGGNSLNTVEMLSQVNNEFGVEINISTFYNIPTIAQLANAIISFDKIVYSPLAPVAANSWHPTSLSQKNIYYQWLLNKNAVNYNIPVAFKIQGQFEVEKLEDILKKLILRHDALRMSFQMASEPQFQTHNEVEFNLDSITCEVSDLDELLKNHVRPFDLSVPQLFRASVFIAGAVNVLFLDFHHIISDGISISGFLNEMLELYAGKQLKALSIRYQDYIYWEKDHLQTKDFTLQKSYWLNELAGELPVLDIPNDIQRPHVFNSAGAKLEFELEPQATIALRKLAAENNCSLHALMFTLYSILLSKYSSQDKVVIGIPVSGRNVTSAQNIHGMFVNNLPIKSEIKEAENFITQLKRTKSQINDAFKHQDFPFDHLVKLLNKKRDISRNPVFDTMFVYQNMPYPDSGDGGILLNRYPFDTGCSKFDISMEVFDHSGILKYNIEYSTNLFFAETIFRFSDHFKNLINAVITNPFSKIAHLSLLSIKETNKYVQKFNSTAVKYPKSKAVHELFEEQVNLHPDRLAIEFNGRCLSYNDLNNKANEFAWLLRSIGVQHNSIVAVQLERSPEFVIAIFGVLKAGGCFLPVEIEIPEKRFRGILADSRCKWLVKRKENTGNPENSVDVSIGFLPDIQVVSTAGGTLNEKDGPDDPCETDALAYIIYTSGTTGNPKGVMISHQSFVNYLTWASSYYIKEEKATFPFYTSIAFDLTLTSVFTPLITGNRVVIYPRESSVSLKEIITDNKCTIIKLTPSHLKLFNKYENADLLSRSNIKKLIVGGEQLDTSVAANTFEKFGGRVEIFNEYGPTEATIGCMIYVYNPIDTTLAVPIGYPIANNRIYLLDKFLKPVAPGIRGEIYIAGDGLAKGYVFNAELTKQKFIINPNVIGETIYKTGDVAKRLADGRILYIGREDTQIKINGYRIDLLEIKQALLKLSHIDQTFVVAGKNKDLRSYLCAYYTSKHSLEESDLRSHLARYLPHYMIPAYLVRLEDIPLTENGKANESLFPDPTILIVSKKKALARNKIEELLLKVWEDVFGIAQLTVSDNFFDLGGDSIKSIQIISRLSELGIDLKTKHILTYQSIEQISPYARQLDDLGKHEQTTLEGHREKTPIENWFFSHQFKNPGYYNQSILLKVKKHLDLDVLKKALKELIKHHDSLRLNYDHTQKQLFYNNLHLIEDIIIEKIALDVNTVPLESFEQEFSVVRPPFTELKAGFNLANTLLLKVAALQQNDDVFLFITMHHLVTDGLSWRIFLKDLYLAYEAIERGQLPKIPPKTASQQDWVHALKQYALSAEVKASKFFWDEAENVDFVLPLDFNTTDWRIENLGILTGSLAREETSYLLKEANNIYNTNVLTFLNLAVALTLNDWTGLNRFVIEQENHGRLVPAIDVGRTMGWFTAMFPITLTLEGNTLGDQIKSIKEQILATPDQGISCHLLKYSSKDGCEGDEKLTEIRLNYLGQFDGEINNDLFSFCDLSTGSESGPENRFTTKLELNMMVVEGKLGVAVSFNTKAHNSSTINWFIESFFNNINVILSYIKQQKEVQFTPSDFDSVNLDQDELDSLFL